MVLVTDGTYIGTSLMVSKSAGPMTVHYATANGTAQAGSDYVAKSGVLAFPPGQCVQTVSVVVRGVGTIGEDD